MFLKRLDIQGFKSFVDKTTLNFSGGITCIVGPNGSGKSNIADAIRWVLGEQSAKSLRGGKMEDVIFVGTENKRPVSFSEVSLTIDNSDNALPLEYQEITITRRLYRSGESEYLINKTPCRLKDIQQLFLDTGVGVEGYSIIGQGRVDEILNGKPEDRRAIFEEASGIMKYKVRKMEAERKLNLTTQNLERINDIINELENQLGPLAEQAETAKKYLEYKYELREYEVSLFVNSINKIKSQVEEIDSKFKDVKSEIDRKNILLEDIKNENSKKNERLKLLEEKVSSFRNEYYEVEKKLSEFHSDIRLNEEKISSLEKRKIQLMEDIDTYKSKKEEMSKSLAELQSFIDIRNAELEKQNNLLKQLEEKYSYILDLMSETARKVEELRKQQNSLNNRYNEKKNYSARLQNQISMYEKRKGELSAEITNIENEKDSCRSLVENSESKVKELESGLNDMDDSIKDLNNNRSAFERDLELLKSRQNELSGKFHQNSSRLKVLKEMEARFEGYNSSVREILNLIRSGSDLSKGIRGAVAQLIRVDAKYETAIETALGQAAQNIVTDTEDDAKRIIDYLKKYKLGRATFLPMTSVTGSSFDENVIQNLKKMKGYVGIAHELIDFDPEYRNIMLSLLGKVIIVDNLENAISMSKNQKYMYKIITLEGDIIRTSGAITGGSIIKGATGTGVLGRSKTIENLEAETARIEASLREITDKASGLADNIKQVIREVEKRNNEKRQLELRIVEARSTANRFREKYNELEAKKQLIIREIEEIENEIKRSEEELNSIENEIVAIEAELISTSRQIEDLEKENSSGRKTVDAMNADLTEKKLSLNTLKHNIQSAMERKKNIMETLENMTMDEESKINEIEVIKTTTAELEQQNHLLNGEIVSFTERQTGYNQEIEKLLEEKNIINEELSTMMDRITNITQDIYKLQEEYSRLEVKKSRIEAEEENYRNRLWDEYELTWSSACELVENKDLGSLTFRQKKISELKGLIKDLGPVNVNAIEDYKTTRERYEFLTVQRNDMEQAKAKLEKVISDMTSIMKKQFLEQFELINKSFAETYKELFDGGKAKIVLSDENDVLGCSVDIEVQPPGKKLQNMMLLSGGERALTAIALLFSIFKLKPSPFCVLDEIEAALDDANVYRFADYIKNFSDRSQFIVITHKKGTMEVSDTLYGVTMEEKGVSKVVSLKL